jgi:1-acyl-sn-glycerol-3-phosphate acyltransferase
MPAGARRPELWRTVRLRIGRPVEVDRYRNRSHDRMLLRELTDEVMYEIRELSGQQYGDEYATRRSEDLPSGPARVSTEGQDPAAQAARPPLPDLAVDAAS